MCRYLLPLLRAVSSVKQLYLLLVSTCDVSKDTMYVQVCVVLLAAFSDLLASHSSELLSFVCLFVCLFALFFLVFTGLSCFVSVFLLCSRIRYALAFHLLYTLINCDCLVHSVSQSVTTS